MTTTDPIKSFDTIPGPADRWWGLPHLFGMRRDYLGYSEQLQRDHGDLVRLRLDAERAVELFDPELLRQALVEHADSMVRWARGPEVFAEASGQNVLVTEGATWQRQRRLLMQAFTPRKVAGYAGLMAQATRDALQALPRAGAASSAGAPGGVSVDMDAFFSHLTMDVILRTLFGSGARTEPQAAAQAVQTLSEIGFKLMFWPASPPPWLPLPINWRKRRALAVLRRVIEGGMAASALDGRVGSGDGHLLAMLRTARDESSGEGLAEQEVFDQCMISFQAGHETTATALLWWSALMARHPEAAERASAEIDAVMAQAGAAAPGAPAPGASSRLLPDQRPDDLSAPTPEQLARMPWLAATLKEAMRLYPPVAALMTRRATRALRIGAHEIPAQTLIRLTPWVLHRDARWFPEPGQFRPERFMPGAPELPRGAYVPFGVGPRVCLGQHFATLEMGLIAAMLLQRFDLSVPPGVSSALPKPRLHITLRPAAPVQPLLLRERQRRAG
jgi:cytochrome P450